MPKSILHLSFTSIQNTTSEAYAKSILNVWFEKFIQFRPEFGNNYEPIRTPIANETDALAVWMQSPFLWKRKSQPYGRGSVSPPSTLWPGDLIFEFDAKPRLNLNDFFQTISAIGFAEFGYLHLMTDTEFRRPLASNESAYEFRCGAFGRNLSLGFSNLGWATVFGPNIHSAMPLEKLREAGFSLVEGGNDRVILKITDDIWDVKSNFSFFNARRILAKQIIGESKFREWSL